MALNEFELIQHFFNQRTKHRNDVILGIGDDAAVLNVPFGHELVVSTDTLVAGRHFPEATRPEAIGYKALAVNLSDLAAMAAEPAWILLALTLPQVNEIWLKKFNKGFFSLMQQFQLQLVGGDLTQGPLTITVQALGFVPSGKALCRRGAQVGDRIYVTGTLGDAGLALALINNKADFGLTASQISSVMQRLNRPNPRIEMGLALRDIANCAIDISDGLVADLGHLLLTNRVGALVQLEKLPLSASLCALPQESAWPLALSAGDDYELCFTVPESKERILQHHLALLNTPYTCIGHIKADPGLLLLDKKGSVFNSDKTGFQHFT